MRLPAMTSKLHTLLLLLAALLLCGCQQQGQTYNAYTPKYVYYPGYTAKLLANGRASIPSRAPERVKILIRAANKLIGKPYRLGGGHGRHHDSAYDCSGSIAFALREAGMMGGRYPTSGDFFRWGKAGYGKWFTVYCKKGHVFMIVCGLRFDTTGSGRGRGPRWYTTPRPCRGFYVRHAPGY